MTDYEKSEEQSWKDYLASDLRKATGEHEWLAHKSGFRDGYRFGQWLAMEQAKAQPVSSSDKFGNPEQLNHIVLNNEMVRVQAAIAAMQGLLSNPDITNRHEDVLGDAAGDAVVAAKYLIEKLDEMKEDGI